jgi:DNA-directed RNA polymerase alpha subunit
LFALSDAELRDLKGFGSKALDEVKDKLAELEL